MKIMVFKNETAVIEDVRGDEHGCLKKKDEREMWNNK